MKLNEGLQQGRKERDAAKNRLGGYTNARIVTRGLPLGDARRDVIITTKGGLGLTNHIPAPIMRPVTIMTWGFATG